MKTFEHDGTVIAYREAGSGPPVLLLHNGGTSSVIWRDQMDALSDRHRAIAIDLPGFGDSPRPAEPLDLVGLVELVHEFMVAQDIVPSVLVGNCMGTNIAATLARRHPEAVTAILAINPLTEASFSGGGLGALHKMQRIAAGPTKVLRNISRRIRAPRPIGTASIRYQLGDKGAAAGLHKDPELLACQLRSDQLPAMVDVLDDMASYGDLDREGVPADIPVWIAWGDQNRVLSRRRAGGLAEKMHAERVTVIPGTGHLPMLEDPKTVTGLIEELVAGRSDREAQEATS